MDRKTLKGVMTQLYYMSGNLGGLERSTKNEVVSLRTVLQYRAELDKIIAQLQKEIESG